MGSTRKSYYAQGTTVSVKKSRDDIETLLVTKYHASDFGVYLGPTEARVAFVHKGRHVQFRLPLPDANDPRFAKSRIRGWDYANPEAKRARLRDEWVQAAWRALYLSIKSKMTTVEAGIVSFEEEFLAQTVMPGGRTAAEIVAPVIEEALRTGQLPVGLALPAHHGEEIEGEFVHVDEEGAR